MPTEINQAAVAQLCRFAELLEREARLLGKDIEVEVTRIVDKLRKPH